MVGFADVCLKITLFGTRADDTAGANLRWYPTFSYVYVRLQNWKKAPAGVTAWRGHLAGGGSFPVSRVSYVSKLQSPHSFLRTEQTQDIHWAKF